MDVDCKFDIDGFKRSRYYTSIEDAYEAACLKQQIIDSYQACYPEDQGTNAMDIDQDTYADADFDAEMMDDGAVATEADSPKSCRCGGTDHLRRSSKKCPEYKGKIKDQQKPTNSNCHNDNENDTDDENGDGAEEITRSVKSSLNQVFI